MSWSSGTDATTLVATSHYGFDNANRLTSLQHYHSDASDKLAGYTWSYDSSGRLVQQGSAWQDGQTWQEDLVDYEYDARGQLVGADYDTGSPLADEAYSYDENGSRIEVTNGQGTATYDEADAYNRLHSDGTYTYSYDDEGNRRPVEGCHRQRQPGHVSVPAFRITTGGWRLGMRHDDSH